MLEAAVNANRHCVEYCRISYDKRGDAEGVGTQHEENQESAEELGEVIARSYVDNDLSAFTKVERPEYARLINDIKAGLIRLIIIRHADRFHRDIGEAVAFIQVAREYGVKVYSGMKGSFYNLNKAAGRKEFLNDTLDANYESDHRGERVTDARKRQARQGAYGGGVRPFGWGVDTGRIRSVCVNPKAPISERRYEDRPVLDMTRHNEGEAAEIQRWAKDLLAGVALDQVLRDLARRDVKTVSQADGRTLKRLGKVVETQGWNSKTLRQILTHPRTAGHSVYDGKIIKRNAFKPIIPEDQRQALITLFADPTRKTSPGNTPRWLGSLIILCGQCNDGSTATVRNNSKGEPTYRCRSKGHCVVNATELDKYLERVLIKRLSRPDVKDLLPANTSVDVASLRDEIVQLQASQKTAARKAVLGQWDEEIADDAIATAEAKIAEIRAELRTATNASPLAEFALTDDAERTYLDHSLGRQREILRFLLTVKILPVGRGRRVPLKERVSITPNRIHSRKQTA